MAARRDSNTRQARDLPAPGPSRTPVVFEPLEEHLLAQGLAVVAGVDEVGRGALAGPVTAAAVVLDVRTHVQGVADSKTLSPKARLVTDRAIREYAVAVSVAHVGPDLVDAIGISAATAQAMREALGALACAVDHVLVDGRPIELGIPATAIVRGDARVRSIAAASIVAKVARDELMIALDARYPEYGFSRHKGYGSAEHVAAIRRLGPCAHHRRSFAPCSQLPLF